jgi:hypothetical protein
MRVESFEFNYLVAQDVSVLGNGSFLHNPEAGIIFLSGDKVNTALCPGPKQIVIDIPFIDRHNRSGRKEHGLGNLHLMDLPVGEVRKDRQISVMIQKQMKLHRPFGLSELRPVKEAGAKLNDRGIQRKELALKSKPALAEVQLPAFAQKVIKNLLV